MPKFILYGKDGTPLMIAEAPSKTDADLWALRNLLPEYSYLVEADGDKPGTEEEQLENSVAASFEAMGYSPRVARAAGSGRDPVTHQIEFREASYTANGKSYPTIVAALQADGGGVAGIDLDGFKRWVDKLKQDFTVAEATAILVGMLKAAAFDDASAAAAAKDLLGDKEFPAATDRHNAAMAAGIAGQPYPKKESSLYQSFLAMGLSESMALAAAAGREGKDDQSLPEVVIEEQKPDPRFMPGKNNTSIREVLELRERAKGKS